eukprot:358862-Chlamydomonas_euryale.AAC.1
MWYIRGVDVKGRECGAVGLLWRVHAARSRCGRKRRDCGAVGPMWRVRMCSRSVDRVVENCMACVLARMSMGVCALEIAKGWVGVRLRLPKGGWVFA